MRLYERMTTVLLTVLFCLSLAACGDDAVQSIEAVVTFTLVGPDATIGAVDYDIDLPTGFALATEADGVTLLAGVVTADSSLPADILIAANYVPEPPVPGQLLTGLASGTGFAPGPLFSVIKTLGGNEPLPDPAEFVQVTLVVSDQNGFTLPGYSMTATVQLRAATL